MKRIILFLAIVIAGASHVAMAQKVAVKTNLLSEVVLSPNLGIEVGLAPKWTLDVSGQLNAWELSHDRQWKHWAVQPEIRYWLCDRFGAHFFWISSAWRTIQHRRLRRQNKLFGDGCP